MPTDQDSTHRFALTRWVAGKTPELTLLPGEVEALKEAREGLLGVLAIEEKFDLLVSGYADLERQLLSVSLHSMLHQDWASKWWREQVREAIRRFSNTLSIVRLYRDQTRHSLECLPVVGSPSLREQFDLQTRGQYDSLFAFRLMETLRNLIQHRAVYVDTFLLPSSWEEMPDEESGEPGRLSFGTDLPLDLDAVLADKKLKSVVHAELTEKREPGKNRLGLRGYLREYVSAWFCIHRHMRELLSGRVGEWDRLWEETLGRQQELDAGPGLSVVEYPPNSRAPALVFYVSKYLQAERRELQMKNSLLEHLGRQHVTSYTAPGEQYI